MPMSKLIMRIPFKTFRLSTNMSSSSNNLIRIGPSAPVYAQKMSEATYTTGQQFWKNPRTDDPYFYAESIPAMNNPIPYMISSRGPPIGQNPYTHRVMRPENSIRRRHSSQTFHYEYRGTHSDPIDAFFDVTTAANNRESKDGRNWEYTTWGSVIGSNYDRTTVGDGTRLVVMSYNILAPSLLENHRYLYNGCKAKSLTVENRIAKFFTEVDDFNPDVLCLQEMEEDYYYETYLNEFRERGYNGVFMKRTRDKVDGCAIMFKTNTLALVDKLGVEYYQPHVDILNRDNIGLLVKLQSKRGKQLKFVVGTTHLLYNPKREDVRIAQIQFLLAEVDRFAFCGFDEFKDHKYHPIILSGDFNTEPFTTGVRLITEGRVATIPEALLLRKNKKVKSGCLPPHFGISDQCQHYKIVAERLKKVKSLKTKSFEFDLKHHEGLTNIGSINPEHNADNSLVDHSREDSRVNISQPNTVTPNIQDGLSTHAENRGPQEPMDDDDDVTIVFERVALPNGSFATKTHPKRGLALEDEDIEEGLDENIIQQINEDGFPCSFQGRELSHALHLKNVYEAQLDRKDHRENIATTKQIGWVCVDYIFYSTIWSRRYQKRVEGNLKLIRRFGLLNRQQCKKMGAMPNDNVSSDHFPLIAEFLLKK